MMNFIALSLIALLSTSSLFVLGVPCSTCQSLPLKDPDTVLICRCDDLCEVYGDCCPDAESPTQTPSVISESLETALPYVECKSRYVSLRDIAVGDSYYMVSSCPRNWTTLAADESFALSILGNCSFSESAEFVEFPPVSDPSTGLTYRNEFCAVCHNVDIAQALTWPTRLRCNGGFENVSQTEEITLDLLRSYCSACSFDVPPEANDKIRETLRWCIPLDEPSCPSYSSSIGINETDYDKLVDSCINGDYNPVYDANPFLPPGILYEGIYRNLDCARCRDVPDFALACLYPSNNTNDTNSDFRCTDVRGEFVIGPLPFSAVLDIRGSGVISLTSTLITEIEVVTCQSNQLFDPVLGCRDIVCPTGYVPISGTCSLPPQPSIPPDNFTGSGDEMNPTNRTTNTFYNSTINCTTTIALDPDEYEFVDNSTVIFRQETFDILGYDSNGRPIICVAFNQSGELISNTSTITVLSYPPGFTELSYIGSTLSIISSILILITYTLFKELRTLPSQLLMNMAVAFLVTDVFLILSSVVSQTVVSIELCTSVSVILHFFLLSRFSWMNCLGIQYTRTFILAVRLRSGKNSGSNNKLLLGYVTAGWGIPLLITLVTVIVNFTVDGSVRYGTDVDGEQGLCWINRKIAAILAFVVPILVSTVLNIIFFLTVIILLCVASHSSTMELKRQQKTIHVRVALGIFTVLGLTWVFGFIALLSNQSWSWYPFIILNSNQAVMIAICFLATKKIVLLYMNLLKCKCESASFRWKTTSTITKSTDSESMASLANIQNVNIK